METEDAAPSVAARMSRLLNRAEYIYLRLLRGAVLLMATILIGYAAWLTASALYKVSRSPDSVVEQKAEVSARELVEASEAAPPPETLTDAPTPQATPEQRRQYATFVDAYFKLYRAMFERFKRSEDKSLSRDEFDDAFVQSQDRLKRVAEAKLDAAGDLEDLNTLLSTMNAAAADSRTVQRLQRYQRTAKVQVCNMVDRVRVEYRRGWDRYSTSCSDWYMDPVGCPATRPVEVPYQERVCSMQLPKGVISHTQLFRTFQDRFFELLSSRRQEFADKATAERSAILLGIEEGKASFGWALYIFGGFLVLMFFFLLIAIEKHQRQLSNGLHGAPAE
jgi:hypothetical protein